MNMVNFATSIFDANKKTNRLNMFLEARGNLRGRGELPSGGYFDLKDAGLVADMSDEDFESVMNRIREWHELNPKEIA